MSRYLFKLTSITTLALLALARPVQAQDSSSSTTSQTSSSQTSSSTVNTSTTAVEEKLTATLSSPLPTGSYDTAKVSGQLSRPATSDLILTATVYDATGQARSSSSSVTVKAGQKDFGFQTISLASLPKGDYTLIVTEQSQQKLGQVKLSLPFLTPIAGLPTTINSDAEAQKFVGTYIIFKDQEYYLTSYVAVSSGPTVRAAQWTAVCVNDGKVFDKTSGLLEVPNEVILRTAHVKSLVNPGFKPTGSASPEKLESSSSASEVSQPTRMSSISSSSSQSSTNSQAISSGQTKSSTKKSQDESNSQITMSDDEVSGESLADETDLADDTASQMTGPSTPSRYAVVTPNGTRYYTSKGYTASNAGRKVTIKPTGTTATSPYTTLPRTGEKRAISMTLSGFGLAALIWIFKFIPRKKDN